MLNSFVKCLLLSLGLVIFTLGPTKAQGVIVVQPQEGTIPLGKFFKVFTDSSKNNTWQSVLSSDKFVNSDNEVLNLGIGNGDHWLLAEIENRTGRDELILNLEQPVIDDAEVFLFNGDQLLLHKQISAKEMFGRREFAHQSFLFGLKVKQKTRVKLLVRVYAEEALLLPIKLSSESKILQNVSLFDFLSGLYYGLMIVMVLYNLFVWYSLRDSLYLYYVAYVFAVGITQACLQGYGYRFLWPNAPGFHSFSVPLAGVASGITTLLFIRRVLQTKRRAPKWDKVLLGLYVVYGVAILLIALGDKITAYKVIDVGALVGAISILGTTITVFRDGYRPAKFILVSWTIFLISVVIFVLKDVSVVPYNTLTSYSLLIGSGVETILLSIALADRINTLKIEKEQSQLTTINTLRENERLIKEQNRLVTEQNVILEQRVEERTADLKKTNEQLSDALQNLKDAQIQLVESEKMATLGQLTAGIAHEINNPINFVISNIKPLRRDFQDIKDVLDAFEDAANDDWGSEKAKNAKNLIAEVDLDYVITEVNQLLDGIDEGAKRTSEIVLGLRNFSRLDERTTKKASMHECLDSTLILLNSMTKNKINILREYGELPEIECQPGKINQVFMNILTNAIQAFDNYEPQDEPQIRILTESDQDQITIKIVDNGPGMPPEVKAHIFEPFYSTKEVGKGTGLGLSIVHGIIHNHSGSIKVESTVGKGTTFIITLPKYQALKPVKM